MGDRVLGVAAPANNSLMLTRLAGENALVLGLPRYARMGGAMPEPPGSIARGRYAPLRRPLSKFPCLTIMAPCRS
jgi:hypothetical protein